MLVAGALLLIAAVAFRPPRLTPAGAAMRARVLGFEQWLGRLDPSGTPTGEPDAVLRRLLPYALVFGFAPRMARAFAPAVSAAGPPDIYYRTRSLTLDVNQAESWSGSFSSSSSGGGGGGSGFSSSGSSGGGGGGGGGRSW